MPTQRNRTGNQALVREINLSTIMNRMHETAPVSRSALAEITGLNKTTVSSLVQELIDHQFVREIGLDSAGTGRPARLLEFNPTAGYIISGEVGVDFVLVTCANFATQVIWRCKESTRQDADQQAVIDHLLTLLYKAEKVIQDLNGPLLGLAVGVPGLVDQTSGLLLFAPNLNWRDVPLGDILRGSFNLPVFVDNEANLAALGEHYFGAARGYNEILYVSAGVGIGGGIVKGGQLMRGATGFAGEFGHMTMNPDGELCNCGNRGCWETQVSQAALFRYIQNAAIEGQANTPISRTNNNHNGLNLSAIIEAARAGDEITLKALDKIGYHLGIGIASLVNALNPELVVFGGLLSLAGDYLLPTIITAMTQRALPWNEKACQVVLAHHGFDACVMGGVAKVYQAILAQPATMSRQNLSLESL